MKRKMTGIAAAYIFGSFFASIFSGLPELLIFAAAAAAVAFIGLRRGLVIRDLALMALSFAVAFTAFTLKQTLSYERITAYAGQTVSFSGKVTELRSFGDNASYTLSGRINGEIPAKLSYYGEDSGARYGDIITIGECTLSLPDSDYLFDGVTYYKSAGVYLEADSAKDVSLERKGTHRIRNAVADYRERMVSRLRMELGTDCGSFLSGMIFGEKQGMSDSLRTSLYRVGIGHVLAVSGLHVSVIAALIMLLMRRLRVNRFAAFALMNAALLLLITAANHPISAIRAALMLEFAYSARLFRRQGDAFNSLAWAVLIICVCAPFVIYSSGFVLSVAGTFGIAVFAPYMTRNIPAGTPVQKLVKGFLIMLCTTLVITPFSMLFFDESSLISPLTNVLLVPLCTFAMVVGLIFVLSGGTLPVLELARLPVELVIRISDRLARIELTHFPCGDRTLVILAMSLAALTAAVCVIFRSRRYTALAAAVSVAVLLTGSGISSRLRYDRFTAAVLGRGKNCAAVFTYHGNTLIFDLSGHYKTPDYVQRYLARTGISEAELLCLNERADSMETAYSQALSGVNVRTVTAEDADISGSGYTVHCSGGVLTAEYADTTVAFLPAGETELPEADLLVFYGNMPKNAAPVTGRDTLYLSGDTNDLEITLGESGNYTSRRL